MLIEMLVIEEHLFCNFLLLEFRVFAGNFGPQHTVEWKVPHDIGDVFDW